jgi:site-specific recombinase XerD
MASTSPWIEAPDAAFRAWIRGAYHEAAGSMHPAVRAWSALHSFMTARQRHIVETSTSELKAYLATFERGSPASARAHRCGRLLAVLHLAFEAIRTAGIRRDNPATPLMQEYPPPVHPLPVLLSPTQRAALAQTFYRAPHHWRQARNRAIALLVLSARLRPAEVAGLRVDEAHRLHQDGGKQTAPTWRLRLTREALEAWLDRRAREQIPGDCAFPLTERGTPCSPRDVYRVLRRILRRAGVDPGQLGRLDVRDCVRRRSLDGVRAGPRTHSLSPMAARAS